VANTHQGDGHMRFDDNAGSAPNRRRNSYGGPVADRAFKEPRLKMSGDADRYEQERGRGRRLHPPRRSLPSDAVG
jgi:catalase